ncbi:MULTISPECIES: hypothetical protein [unclassified Oleiphilus]|uniref:hypothetical protein n=1 Tax=unclassified Oleiphilus TaxID=2631174 RepID=UPI0007C2D710|nr:MULTISPECIES: hypothetical protein [unclassified Oleiphilus]KZZ36815.1 hypothetical protein A3757_13055 [Oleiphilus sp. HI0117]KZZ55155.1 hypothetical protein A3761_12665 [Oleiphilus sp. HI0123]
MLPRRYLDRYALFVGLSFLLHAIIIGVVMLAQVDKDEEEEKQHKVLIKLDNPINEEEEEEEEEEEKPLTEEKAKAEKAKAEKAKAEKAKAEKAKAEKAKAEKAKAEKAKAEKAKAEKAKAEKAKAEKAKAEKAKAEKAKAEKAKAEKAKAEKAKAEKAKAEKAKAEKAKAEKAKAEKAKAEKAKAEKSGGASSHKGSGQASNLKTIKPRQRLVDGIPGSEYLIDKKTLRQNFVLTKEGEVLYKYGAVKAKQIEQSMSPRHKLIASDYLKQGFKKIESNLVRPKRSYRDVGKTYYGQITYLQDSEGYFYNVVFKQRSGSEDLDKAFMEALLKTGRLAPPIDPKVRNYFLYRKGLLYYGESDFAN